MHRTGIEIVRRLVLVLTLAAPAMALPFGAPGAETVIGVFALPDSAQEGSGEMTVTELAPLAAELEVTFADARTGQRITEFAEELTQQLHLLAIDETLTRLIHEHVKTAGEEGVFTARMQFPSPVFITSMQMPCRPAWASRCCAST